MLELKLKERIELLRTTLYEAIDNGNTNEILKASVELDIEIVNAMLMIYTRNKNVYS